MILLYVAPGFDFYVLISPSFDQAILPLGGQQKSCLFSNALIPFFHRKALV